MFLFFIVLHFVVFREQQNCRINSVNVRLDDIVDSNPSK